MVDAVSRELILPAIRLDVPPRPTGRQLSALAERSAEQWTTAPLTWTTGQVVRLAVAQVLAARLRPGPGRVAPGDAAALPEDPEQVTLGQLATLFRPHVGLAAQAFALAVVESVNAGVPAAVEPVREGLRRVGVTGREPVRMVALGLDKLPARARSSFWASARTSSTVTAVVDALAGGGRHGAADLSGLERSHLSRADALLIGGGRTTPVVLSARGQDGQGGSWLQVPLAVTRAARPGRGPGKDAGRRGAERPSPQGAEVGLRGDGWLEVFETALDAVASAMAQIDQGSKPRGRVGEPVEVLATRLVAAKDRSVAEVCASLRDIDPFVLEMFDHQVITSSVPVAVPALEDDLFVQLWLPTSALAGPLFTGAADLFLGGTPVIRGQVGRDGAAPGGQGGGQSGGQGGAGGRDGRGRPGGRGRGGAGGTGDPAGHGQPGQPGEGRRTRGEGGQSGRRRKPRPVEVPDNSLSAGPDPAPAPESAPQKAPDPAPAPVPDTAPAGAPAAVPDAAPESQGTTGGTGS